MDIVILSKRKTEAVEKASSNAISILNFLGINFDSKDF